MLVSEVSDGEPVGSLDGLVLLDLPDFDSRETAHRAEAERVLALCDVFVWVTDPQKYADALLHDEYVRQLAGHSAVMLVVLNQVDRLLSESAVEACRDDLVRLLKADGVEGVQVLTTSVATGRGISTLRQRLANAVAGHEAARQRLSADLTAVAGRLRRGVAESEASLDAAADDRLIDALSRASGVPVVLNAVDEDYRREALGRTGWIFTRWGRKLRPDPLRRLRLDRVPSQVLEQVDPLDVREIVGRSSIPAPSASARSAVKLAALSLTERAADGLPVLWAEAVTDAAAPTDDRLYERLDRIVVTTPLRANPPMWWQLMGWLQWVLGLLAVVGLAWLVVLGVVSWLQLPPIDTPKVGTVPAAHAAAPGRSPAGVARRVGGPGPRPGGSATSSGGRREAAAQRDRRRGDGPAGRAGPLGPRPASRDAGAAGGGPPRLSRRVGCPQPASGSSRRPQGDGRLWPALGRASHARSGRCRGAPTPTGNWVEEQQ